MMPLTRGRENADSGVFLTVPAAVAMKMNCPSAYSRTGNKAVMRSSSCSCSRLTIGLPREPRLAIGTCQTFSQ